MLDRRGSKLTDHDVTHEVESRREVFRQQWLAGKQPRIEDVLDGVSGEERVEFLKSLLLLEVDCRRRFGEIPETRDYLGRFPEVEEEIQDLLDTAGSTDTVGPSATATVGPSATDDTATKAPVELSDQPTIAPGRIGSDPGDDQVLHAALSDHDPTIYDQVPSSTPAPNIQLEGYEILGVLGRGGMGVVYRALDIRLKRVVALKMILAGVHAGPEELERFHREAEAVAQLQHPNIVQIHDVGEHEGRHFFSMEYVAGPSLSDCLTDGPLAPGKAAAIMVEVSQAIAYAHERGVIHRDLKPANVLMEPDGRPKVTDFGLAKRVEADERLTSTGQILGTPGYMAPEQAAGQIDEVNEAADIYALGAMLYALVTGRPPFQADNPLDTMIQVLEEDPAPLRLLNPKVDPDLETICLKCLEKDPEHRYVSAAGVAEDLARFGEGESISVKSVNVVGRMIRALRRSKHDVELRAWGTMLFWFAGIVLLSEIGVFAQSLDGITSPYPTKWTIAIRVGQLLAMGLVLWAFRSNWSISTGIAERQMLSIWVGFLVACHLVIAVAILSVDPESSNGQWKLEVYPYLTIISGLAYFVMGSNYWGQCYLCAFLFFATALVMPATLRWAPLEFGLLWAVCLTLIGMRLRQLSSADVS